MGTRELLCFIIAGGLMMGCEKGSKGQEMIWEAQAINPTIYHVESGCEDGVSPCPDTKVVLEYQFSDCDEFQSFDFTTHRDRAELDIHAMLNSNVTPHLACTASLNIRTETLLLHGFAPPFSIVDESLGVNLAVPTYGDYTYAVPYQ